MSTRTIIDEIKEDHKELQEYYDNYKKAVSPADSAKWFHQFVWENSRHAVGEELVLYPLMEGINDKGKELAEKSREDHRVAKQLLYEANKEKDPVVLDAKLDVLMTDLMEHIQKEEAEDLIFIADNVSPKNLERAGRMFQMKKKLVPTRPHPDVPDKPAAIEAALGLLLAPIDKFKDLFRSFPDNA